MTGRTKLFLKQQWDTLIALIVAAVLSILSALDVVDGDLLAAAVLAVLALVGVALVKDRDAREQIVRSSAVLGAQIEHVNQSLTALHDSTRHAAELHHIHASDISLELERAMAVATFWRYKGGTGTYLRAETLPRLSESFVRRREVWIEIIDPSDLSVCKRYADYRRRLKHPRSVTDQRDAWSPRRVRIQAYATVLAAAWFNQHRNLRIHLGLSRQMSTLRYEMSSESFIVNNEEGVWAFGAKVKTSTYDCFYDELVYSFEQSRHVDLEAVDVPPAHELTYEHVPAVIERLGVASLHPTHHSPLDTAAGDPDEWTLTPEMHSQILHHAISEAHAARLGFTGGGARNPYLASVHRPDVSAWSANQIA